MKYYWDSKIEYLMKSRELYFNEDYLEFLIDKVWKINCPIDIIDFGCGFGYLGLRLLPLMPKGTTYTGIDQGEELLNKAKEIFKELPYKTNFIQADVNNLDVSEFKFDLAICQALLLHMEKPKVILNKMIESIKPEGKVICIEPHRISATANIYISEVSDKIPIDLGNIQKIHNAYKDKTGKDGNIGFKIPNLMRECGLVEVECRVSDKVTYLNSNYELSERKHIFDILNSEGICPQAVENEEEYLKRLMNNNLTHKEATRQIQIDKKLNKELTENGLLYNILFAPTMMISFAKRKKCP